MANSTTLYVGPDGRTTVDVTENKTLAATDSGIVQNVITDAITITLPATAANLCYSIRNGGVPKSGAPAGTGDDFSCLVTVAPNSADGVSGLAFTAATNKAILNTKATARVGDELRIIGSGTTGVTAWQVLSAKGVWARAA